MLFLDGVYVPVRGGVDFRRVKPPSAAELDALIYRISERVGGYLEQQGLLVRDMDNSYLTLESRADTAMGSDRAFHDVHGRTNAAGAGCAGAAT